MATAEGRGWGFVFFLKGVSLEEVILDSHILNLFHWRQRNLARMNFAETAFVLEFCGSRMRLVIDTWELEIFGFQCNGVIIIRVYVLESL